MKKNITIKEIRQKYQYYGLYSGFVNDHILSLLSPYFTKVAIKGGLIPNQVTLLMILSGIIGAALFSVPNQYSRVAGIVFMTLWYIFDLSDGEVARITKKYSKYGKEIDYTAHTINHPLYTLSFITYTIQYDLTLSLIIVALGLFDSIFRNIQTFDIIWALKESKDAPHNDTHSTIKHSFMQIIKYVFLNISAFPVFVNIFPILLLLWNVGAFYYAVAALIATIIIDIISVARWLRRIVYYSAS